jgi:hypothetical protein
LLLKLLWLLFLSRDRKAATEKNTTKTIQDSSSRSWNCESETDRQTDLWMRGRFLGTDSKKGVQAPKGNARAAHPHTRTPTQSINQSLDPKTPSISKRDVLLAMRA